MLLIPRLGNGQLGAGLQHRQPSVINGFSDLILELYGPVSSSVRKENNVMNHQ